MSIKSFATNQPNNTMILNNFGIALQMLGYLGEADDIYKQALVEDANYLKPYSNLAVLYQQQGRDEDAIRTYSRYLALAPENGEAHFNLGLLYLSKSEWNNGYTHFEEALEFLHPVDTETATNLGASYLFLGRLNEAIDLLEQVLAGDEEHLSAWYYLGVAYLFNQGCQQAVSVFERVIETDPDYPQAKANLGVAYLTAGQPEEAIPIFTELIAKEPQNPSNFLNLGLAYQDTGKRIKAQIYFQKVIELNPHSDLAQKAHQAIRELM